jgi:hypothetical protein
LTKAARFLENCPATMPSTRHSAALNTAVEGSPMNSRNATLMDRQRKNIKFEQERVASLDHDVQRAGGTHAKESPKPSKKASKDHKSPTKHDE